MKIVITGGAGYVGAALAERLSFLPDIEEIRIFDNLSSGNYDFFFHAHLNREKIIFTQGDILETRKLPKLLTQADVVIHLASLDISGSDNASLHRLEQVNHWGTAELSYALEKSEVKKVIHLSSCEVYGFSEEAKSETDEPLPATPYALSKFRGEQHILRLQNKLSSHVLRTGIISGHSPVKNLHGVASKMFFDALIRKRVSIYGDGKQIRPVVSLTYVTDKIVDCVQGRLIHPVANVFEANMSILDILDEVISIIPDTEFIFTNHHFSLPGIKLKSIHEDLQTREVFSLRNEYEQILKYFRL